MMDEWRVQSAGTWTMGGLPAAAGAVESATRLGLALADHVSQVIAPGLIQDADVVIVMKRGQDEALQQEYVEARDKVRRLSDVAAGLIYDVPHSIAPASAADMHAEIVELVHRGF